ncbi:UvrD-helicase domain-containing protein [Nocardioides bruguierae]|uniref:UvrD-helicase domain-containing protein n=1 Tax=Nocardioides bruguierae TaxID=2945102 RepID=UPI0020224575|nr:UvrD-helicase domain-containing protein [Nocardioides bruguierae]MCL8026460.1 UvrD-helicase domain-containing protein [Nocardioides bruguierae]
MNAKLPDLDPASAAAAAAFAAALPASVTLPAGAGKTHLLAATARRIIDEGGTVLVLTHTNAGVHAIQRRLQKFGVTSNVRVSTLTSFAFLLARAYPVLGQMRVPEVPNWSDSPAYVTAARRIATSNHMREVLVASFTHMLVDEYQDCSEDQHELVCALAEAIPATGVLGDPMQAIFGFKDTNLVTWDAVTNRFPDHLTDVNPWRWVGHNEALGAWLLDLRTQLVAGRQLSFHQLDPALRVSYRSSVGSYQAVPQVVLNGRWPADESVVVLTAFKTTIRSVGGKLNGRFTIMEEISGDFMIRALTELADLDLDGYSGWLYKLVKDCTCGHAGLNDPVKKGLARGRTVGHLSRPGLEQALAGFDAAVTEPSFGTLVEAMDTVMKSPALRLHSHEAWFDIQAALVGAVAAGNDPSALTQELARARDRIRHQGRRDRGRVVSRTLLVKGLEYDHVVIDNIERTTDVNNLYVALTRARKSITVIGDTHTITVTAT